MGRIECAMAAPLLRLEPSRVDQARVRGACKCEAVGKAGRQRDQVGAAELQLRHVDVRRAIVFLLGLRAGGDSGSSYQ